MMRIDHRRRTRMIQSRFARSAGLEQARGRILLMITVFMALFVLIGLRAFNLAVIEGQGFQGEGEARLTYTAEDVKEHILKRGRIYDRNGVMMAGSLETASLYADPQFIDDPKAAASGLAQIFPDLTYGEVLQKLQSQRRFVWIKRNITPEEQYKVLELGQPGLEFEREDRRIYPQENLAAHILGYTDIDNHGLAGVERSFNQYLAKGDNLTLTIDSRVQHALRRELLKAVQDFSAKGGTGIVMDVQTGEVLAGVSLPDFKPHDISHADQNAFFNRMTLGVYELGSVFKIFSTAALFEAHDLPMGTTFDAREPIEIGGFTINDFHAQDRELTIPEIFMYSSNIGSALMAQQVGTESLRKFYRDLGLLTPLEIEIDEVGRPLIPSPWRDVNTLTAAYGHGIATTPLQMVSAVSSIVNGGLVVKPTLIKNAEEEQPREQLRLVSRKTAHKIKQLMRLVVTHGTGSKADVPGYHVGGKTGTAEKSTAQGYDHDKLISSFIGVFPMDAPRYAIYIMVDEPRGNEQSFGYATAGWVAAPAVARVVQSMAAVLGIPARQQPPEDFIEQDLIRYIERPEEEERASRGGLHHASY